MVISTKTAQTVCHKIFLDLSVIFAVFIWRGYKAFHQTFFIYHLPLFPLSINSHDWPSWYIFLTKFFPRYIGIHDVHHFSIFSTKQFSLWTSFIWHIYSLYIKHFISRNSRNMWTNNRTIPFTGGVERDISLNTES